MKHLSNCLVGNVGQLLLAQGSPQRRKRPRDRLIFLAGRGTLHFLQNECPILARIRRFPASSWCNREGCQPTLIETRHQLANSVSALETRLMSCLGKGLPISDCQEHFGSPHDIDALTARFD